MGVVGMVLVPSLGGGVTAPFLLAAAVASCKAAIFEAVEVLNGRRFIGGNLNGCRLRFFAFFASFAFLSVAGSASIFVA